MGWSIRKNHQESGHGAAPVTLRVGGVERAPLAARPTGPAAGAVEVVFVFDTTGSMMDKIDGLIGCTEALIADLEHSGLGWSVTAVPFGDLTVEGDTIETGLPWATDFGSASIMLRSMPHNFGGGNNGESSHEAVLAGLAKQGSSGALRVLILITDEPPLTQPVTAAMVHDAVVAADALMFVLSPSITSFKALATDTGGEWFEISANVDLASIAATLQTMGRRLALRATTVAALGGSPQAALALESGRGR